MLLLLNLKQKLGKSDLVGCYGWFQKGNVLFFSHLVTCHLKYFLRGVEKFFLNNLMTHLFEVSKSAPKNNNNVQLKLNGN